MIRRVRIEYEHFAAPNAHLGRAFWSGIFTDTNEGFDYDTKKGLIESCKENGYEYEVIRNHRNGKRSVIERG